jgi:E3 ubiquitin-protein ligase BIG BROTHER and related proteins
MYDVILIESVRFAGPTALESSREGGVALVEDNDSDGMDDMDNDDDEVHVDNMSYEQLTALGEVVGTVAVGLSEEQIAALPRVKYATASKLTSRESCYEGAEQCAVCRVEFEADDDVAVLTCHHVYHPDCVGQWLRRKKTCPQCGTEMDVHGGSRDLEDNKRSH